MYVEEEHTIKGRRVPLPFLLKMWEEKYFLPLLLVAKAWEINEADQSCSSAQDIDSFFKKISIHFYFLKPLRIHLFIK